MRVIELSNHPADEMRLTEHAIVAERRAVVEHGQAVGRLRSELAAARRWWQFARRFRDRRALRKLKDRGPRRDPAKPHRLAQQRAGVAAENEVTSDLSVLPDQWVVIRGYANRRGEIDHVLVGPRGVWAIEVKGRGIRVNVNGDRWSFEKFDRYGNLVDHGPLVDRGGRGWGRQVTDIAGDLEQFLRSRGAAVTVETAVVVMHDRAKIGTCVDLGVSMLSIGTGKLLSHIREQPATIDARGVEQISNLIRRDHSFHAQRRKRARR